MTVAKIDNHVDVALGRVASQFRGKPNVETFLTVLVTPIQRAEDALWQLFTERGIENAIGNQLKVIGKIVGERYAGQDEDTYRRLVRARIRTNKSNGTVDDLLAITGLVLDEHDADIVTLPQYPAGLVIRVDSVLISDALSDTLVRFLRKAVAAGVHLIVETYEFPIAEMLVLPLAAFLNGAASSAATSITVGSTEGFPDTGTLVIDEGLAVQETVTYSAKTSTTFTCSALAHNHQDRAAVVLETGLLGLGTESDDTVGGRLSRAKD